MRPRPFVVALCALLFALGLVPCGVVVAQSPIPAKECSSLIENRDACRSTVTTYSSTSGLSTESPATAVAAQASNSPPPVRISPKVAVTVVVHKRPLETVSSQLTCNQPAKPDVIGTIVSKLATPLGGLTLYTQLLGEPPPEAHVAAVYFTGIEAFAPGGQVKVLHSWPGQIPPADARGRMMFTRSRCAWQPAPQLL